jgi:hypothetical protein
VDNEDAISMDREFLRALVAREFDFLEQILADDFVLIDLSGSAVSRDGFLGSLRSGDLIFEAIQPEDVSVRVYDHTALVRGRTAMRGSFKSAPFAFNSRYTHTYIRQIGRCQMVAAQGTPIAG